MSKRNKFNINDLVIVSSTSTSKYSGKTGKVLAYIEVYRWGRFAGVRYKLSFDNGSATLMESSLIPFNETASPATNGLKLFAVIGIGSNCKPALWSESMLTYNQAEEEAIRLQETMTETEFMIVKAIKKTTKPTVQVKAL